jgi:cysteine-rich repeat protein
VSVDSNGVMGGSHSNRPAISASGRYVAYQSLADNLVANDHNQGRDVFVHDMTTGATVRVSVNSDGSERPGESRRPSMSADGRFVTFEGDDGNITNIYVHDRDTDANGTFDEVGGTSTVRVSVNASGTPGDNDSKLPSISNDGRFVAFQSAATNLVPGDHNRDTDIFVIDRDSDHNGTFDEPGGTTITRASVLSDGTEASSDSQNPSISGDGRYVVFTSFAKNLVPNDTNNAWDVFLHDMSTAITTRVSVSLSGVQGNGDSVLARISADGRLIAFASSASNLVPNDTNQHRDAFILDRDSALTGTFDQPGNVSLVRVSIDSDGNQGNLGSCDNAEPSMSDDGLYVAFSSDATNLVANDFAGRRDVFVHEVAACGDGILTRLAGEICDDGNTIDGDGCDSNCTPTGCGNGIKTASEGCDHGNANGSDHCCSAACALVDFDGDQICDLDDLSDVGGFKVRQTTLRQNVRPHESADGSLVWQAGMLVAGVQPYLTTEGFFAQVAATGLSFSIYTTASAPNVSDPPFLAFVFAPTDCNFRKAPRRVDCQKVFGTAPATIAHVRFDRKSKELRVKSTVSKLDIVTPPRGPVRIVLNANDPLKLDYQNGVSRCTYTSPLVRPKLVCKPPPPA